MKKNKRKPICPLRHVLLVVSALLILVLRGFRNNRRLMQKVSTDFVRPVLQNLGEKCAAVEFSVAEMLIAAFVLFLLVSVLYSLERTRRRGGFILRLYRLIITLLSFTAAVYAGFCLLWGVYYYGDDFTEQSGLRQEPVSSEQLSLVTLYFAEIANGYADQVPRDISGVCEIDRTAVLDCAAEIYIPLEQDFPCLYGPSLRPKPVRLSRMLSYLDFTGFFFPFTGEANVNMDSPSAFFAATVAHELAHQRGVAKEQEANFVAVLACMRSEKPEFVYSASLLAYTHLSNSLYSSDRAAWERIYSMLYDQVKRDLLAEREYWEKFQTPVREVSNSVYESFLQSYDQTLGLRSYGACVDLLVNYYYINAEALYGGQT